MDVQTLITSAGGVAALAAKLGVARTTVIDWRRSKTIPANRVVQISQIMGVPIDEVVKLASQVAA